MEAVKKIKKIFLGSDPPPNLSNFTPPHTPPLKTRTTPIFSLLKAPKGVKPPFWIYTP